MGRGTFLKESYKANLTEFFRYVRELFIEVTTLNDSSSLTLLCDIPSYLQNPQRLVPHLLRFTRLQVAVEDVYRSFFFKLSLCPANVYAKFFNQFEVQVVPFRSPTSPASLSSSLVGVEAVQAQRRQ